MLTVPSHESLQWRQEIDPQARSGSGGVTALTFGARAFDFYTSLAAPRVPRGVVVMNPYTRSRPFAVMFANFSGSIFPTIANMFWFSGSPRFGLRGRHGPRGGTTRHCPHSYAVAISESVGESRAQSVHRCMGCPLFRRRGKIDPQQIGLFSTILVREPRGLQCRRVRDYAASRRIPPVAAALIEG